VIDSVLLRAIRDLRKNPRQQIGPGKLIRLAIRRLEAEAKRSKFERSHGVHLEDDVPETPPEREVVTLGEDELDFHVPEEDWKLHDVIPDLEMPDPEQATEWRELRSCVDAALASMPSDARRALWLQFVEELDGAELASALGTSLEEGRTLVERAREELKRRLTEAGCSFRGE
jgi:RNA polymerase sigma factor (sigma-70 family)